MISDLSKLQDWEGLNLPRGSTALGRGRGALVSKSVAALSGCISGWCIADMEECSSFTHFGAVYMTLGG